MNRIKVYMAPGEGKREEAMRQAIGSDKRFEPLANSSDIPVDLQFSVGCEEYESCPDSAVINRPDCVGKCNPQKYFNMELKRPDDFAQSVLSGHLMDQTLSIRESGYNGCTVILGDLEAIQDAIKDASKLRAGKYLRGTELAQATSGNYMRCKSFRKRSFLNGVPVFWQGDDSGFFDGDDQWKDILEFAHDFLLDGDMLGFRMRPPDNEREICAASMLYKGIGSDSMRALLKEYTLAFVPRGIYARPIEELPGWGKKRCEMVNPRVRMVYR